MADRALLEIEDVWKSYRGETGRVDVLSGISLRLRARETLALTGESGSGKSTLLHLAGGLDLPDRGTVTLQGDVLSTPSDTARAERRRGDIGIVFQQFNLIPSLNVGGNIAFQARLAGRYDAAWCEEIIQRLGLAQQSRKFPEQLSGGQQQRVAIGRALAARPALILADEPTGNLDETTSDQVLDLMLALVADTGTGLLMVTHSERLADRMDRRLHLSSGSLAA